MNKICSTVEQGRQKVTHAQFHSISHHSLRWKNLPYTDVCACPPSNAPLPKITACTTGREIDGHGTRRAPDQPVDKRTATERGESTGRVLAVLTQSKQTMLAR